MLLPPLSRWCCISRCQFLPSMHLQMCNAMMLLNCCDTHKLSFSLLLGPPPPRFTICWLSVPPNTLLQTATKAATQSYIPLTTTLSSLLIIILTYFLLNNTPEYYFYRFGLKHSHVLASKCTRSCLSPALCPPSVFIAVGILHGQKRLQSPCCICIVYISVSSSL